MAKGDDRDSDEALDERIRRAGAALPGSTAPVDSASDLPPPVGRPADTALGAYPGNELAGVTGGGTNPISLDPQATQEWRQGSQLPPTEPGGLSQQQIDQFIAQRGANKDELISQVQKLGAQRNALLNTPTPQVPVPPYRDIPKPPQQQYRNVFKESGPGLIFIAAMGALATRGKAIGAMNAATGYMEGFHTGDKEKMELSRQNWQDNVDAVIKENHVINERYNAALNNQRISMADKQGQLQAIAASTNDQVMIHALNNGQMDFAIRLPQDRAKAIQHLQEAQIHYGGVGRNPQNIALRKFMEENPEATAEDLQRFLQRSRPARSAAAMSLQRYLDENPNATSADIQKFQAQQSGLSQAARLQSTAVLSADRNALSALVKQQTAIASFEKTAVLNGKVLVELAKQVDRTGVPVMERWIRAGRQAVAGDPLVSKFNAQMTLYTAEVAKILTNPNMSGVLTDSARQEAASFINKASSAKQIESVVKLLEQDFGRRNQGLEEQRNLLVDRITGGGGASTKTEIGPDSPVHVNTPEEAERLPSGTKIILPDGTEGTVP